MVRPAAFAYNPETAADNAFQRQSGDLSAQSIQSRALKEFDRLVEVLRSENIDVLVIDDTPDPPKPDAVFPNNWIATMPDGELILFPMYAPMRRKELRQDIVSLLMNRYGFRKPTDLSPFEKETRFLEGTGSMVFDHNARIAYACRSERTDESLFIDFCRQRGYRSLLFRAEDQNGQAIYHTNVMMTVGQKMALVCFESLPDKKERKKLRAALADSGKEAIPLSMVQMQDFAGNALEVNDKNGRPLLLMSDRAFRSLNHRQLQRIEAHAAVIHSDIPTIEETGGGSVRCMLAELHLPLG